MLRGLIPFILNFLNFFCPMFTEEKRQIVHILLLLLAFLLKYYSRWYIAGILFLLLLASVFLVPKSKIKVHLYRSFENNKMHGGFYYFLALIIIVLIFPLPIAAASWAILALGDGMATLVGKNFKDYQLPWNKHKSYPGTISFIIFGAIGAFILLKWMIPEISIAQSFSLGLKAAIVAGIIESLPLRVNDNITVLFASALSIFLLT